MKDYNRYIKTDINFEIVWMNMVRGVSIIAIVIHHWLLILHNPNSPSFFYKMTEFIQDVTGTFVHIFFILSGCGLTLSYFGKGFSSWKAWGRRRFEKIILPYWIIIFLTFVFANFIHYILPQFVSSKYSGTSLFSYLTFTRNFYSPGWELNPTLWFIPVIVGLYIVFPLLVVILKKYGSFGLLLFSLIVTYVSITASIYVGYSLEHQRAVFLFYVIEFSLGMTLGYILYAHGRNFLNILGFKSFCLGFFCFIISWGIRSLWPPGSYYKGVLTATGIFLITLYICNWINRLSPLRSRELLSQFSEASYLMYLIHGPLILFLAKPLIQEVVQKDINPLILIILGCLYCIAIFVLVRLLSSPVNRLSSRLVGIL